MAEPGAARRGAAIRICQTARNLAQHHPDALLILALLAALVVSTFLGRYPAPYGLSPMRLMQDELAQRLVWTLRLPRILAACLLGMTLAACGTVLQMIFRNPLVEPGFLGVSQGAAFGAALSIIYLGRAPLVVEASAALFACLGLALTYTLARRARFGGWILRLVMAGLVVSALFSSGVGVLKYMADPLTELQDIIFWMMGGLWSIEWKDVLYLLPVVAAGLTIVFLMRWRLNLLSLDDDTSFSLGAAPGRERALLLVAAVGATAAVVSVAGIVGWIGLLIPHAARRLRGADAQASLPTAILLGGIFALFCDDLARVLMAGEIPLGILTALFGGLLFLTMMLQGSIRVQR